GRHIALGRKPAGRPGAETGGPGAERLGGRANDRAGRSEARWRKGRGQGAEDCTRKGRRRAGRQAPVREDPDRMTPPAYEIYAVKYAHHERTASQNFLGGDPHDGPLPLEYFVWLVRGDGREFVVDTGFKAAAAARRQRRLLRPVDEALALHGVDTQHVREVVITHLHYDHVGNFDLFPRATFHLQDLEMQYATGRCM